MRCFSYIAEWHFISIKRLDATLATSKLQQKSDDFAYLWQKEVSFDLYLEEEFLF
jgi:hypothetical protein